MYQYVWRIESILVWTLKSKQFTDGNLLFLSFNKQNVRVVFYLIANNWQFLISRVKMAIDNHWDLVIWPMIGLKVDARIWCVTSLVNFELAGVNGNLYLIKKLNSYFNRTHPLIIFFLYLKWNSSHPNCWYINATVAVVLKMYYVKYYEIFASIPVSTLRAAWYT